MREECSERPRFHDTIIQRVIDAVRPDCRPLFTFIWETGQLKRENSLGGQVADVLEVRLAGPTRLELATSGVTGRRSNQAELRPRLMSAHYRPIAAD